MLSPFLSYFMDLSQTVCVAGGDESDLLDPLRLSGDPNLCRARPLHSELSPPRLAALHPCQNTLFLSLFLCSSLPLCLKTYLAALHPCQNTLFIYLFLCSPPLSEEHLVALHPIQDTLFISLFHCTSLPLCLKTYLAALHPSQDTLFIYLFHCTYFSLPLSEDLSGRSPPTLQRHITGNSKQIFPEKEMLRPQSQFSHVSVLQENMWTDPGNI
jgi:hypothetical protein